MNKKKVCMVSSTGGHFMELIQLIPALNDINFYIVTEKNPSTVQIVEQYPHHYLIQQQRRGWMFPFKFAYNIMTSIIYLLKEKPSTIITTGAGASYPTCKWAKILGKKVIYIESFAKLNNESVTGRMIYPFADKFFVQWPEMLSVYPKAEYHGTVY